MTEAHIEERIATLTQILRSTGLRATPQRLEIIKAIVELPTHPSAEAVFQRVRLTHPTMSLATVYVTLDRLVKMGALQEVVGTTERHYDGRNPQPHAHLVCRVCGCIADVAMPPGWENMRNADNLSGFAADVMQVTLLGTCAHCQKTPL